MYIFHTHKSQENKRGSVAVNRNNALRTSTCRSNRSFFNVGNSFNVAADAASYSLPSGRQYIVRSG